MAQRLSGLEEGAEGRIGIATVQQVIIDQQDDDLCPKAGKNVPRHGTRQAQRWVAAGRIGLNNGGPG
jgi:hypothetical protein